MNVPLTGYVVVRYIPDLGRNEALNVGIIAWTNNAFRIRIDREAMARVLSKTSAWLTGDAAAHLETSLNEQLSQMAPEFTPSLLLEFLEGYPGYAVSFTEARYTMVSKADGGLEATLERLLERVVR